MKFITLFELKLYYLLDVFEQNANEAILFGTSGNRTPTLTGWIKYWREATRDSRYTIIYSK